YEYAKENESETDMSDHEWEKVMMEDNEGDEWEDEDDGFDESCDEAGDAGEETGEEESDGPGDNDTTGGESSDEESSKEEDSKDSKKSKEGDSDEDESKKGSPGSGTEGGEDGSFSDYEPESKTDENFRNNEIELVSNEAKPYKYVNIPHDIPLENVIVNFTDLYKDYEDHYARWNELGTSGTNQVEMATEKFNDFRSKNKKIVEYLAKEFEMKKAAKEHSRAATANTGILSSEKLYTYKYNEHIFKKITITPNGKNHGLVMWVDWSGSMSQNMKGTIEQMMILVMFCKRVNIPFEVYAFSDSYNRRENYGCIGVSEDGYLEGKNGIVYGDIIIGRFNLLNLFSSKMRAKQLRDAYIYMTATSEHFTSSYSYGYRRDEYITIPEKMSLGGTPLDHSLIMGFSVMRDFMKRNPVDVINSIYLTDGDSHGCNGMWKVPEEDGRNNRGMFCVRSENVVLRDPISKKQHLCTDDGDRYSRKGLTTNLVKFQREVFDINIVNFFLVQRMKKWDIARMLEDVKGDSGNGARNAAYISDEDLNVTLKKFRKDKYMIIPEGQGFNELYTILGGKHLEVQEEQLEVAEDASVAQMARAFKKFSSGKLEKRKLLSRFIDMVAA
ncbi:MAG: hypothetical protein MK200_06900, partial [Nitrosopumilus sp.]|nr:hypothetical protein [Nitrosopumilus sp.]